MGAASPPFRIGLLLSIAAIVASLLAAPLLAGTGPDISGTWLRSGGAARVNIAACGAQVCAIDTWVQDTIRDEKVGDQFVMTLEARFPS